MTPKTHTLTPSLEDYLEAILDLGSPARVTAIAARLGVAKASVTEAVRKLSSLGLVDYVRYGRVSFKAPGDARARDIRGRHDALTSFLVNVLSVPRAVAERDACVLEHGLSPETATRLLTFVSAKTRRVPKRPPVRPSVSTKPIP